MTKLLVLTLTITAVALSSSFAECSGGGCKKPGKKKEDPAHLVIGQTLPS